jgi:hypothetical protein
MGHICQNWERKIGPSRVPHKGFLDFSTATCYLQT